MHKQRLHNQPSVDVINKEIALCHKLAGLYLSFYGKKKHPYAREMAMESYRIAASIDDTKAQLILANHFLEEAKLRKDIQQQDIFASSGNEKRMEHLFGEALAYLKAAESLGNSVAKRLHGLCYINGWGLEPDKDHGFELVVQSIEQENSWEKVPQIFAEIGLNKPEFFAAIMQRRKG